MIRRVLLISLVLPILLDGKPSVARAVETPCGVRPEQLRCEYLANPLGIDELEPRLSWKLRPAGERRRGLRQTAYQILVASSPEALAANRGDLWDSGRVASDRSIHVPYRGAPLTSRMSCWWKVRVWDELGRGSAWSKPASWSMGLLDAEDWRPARWIGLDEGGADADPAKVLQGARWVWFPEGDARADAPAETRCFVRAVTIPADREITGARCFFAADDEAVLYVNGRQVAACRGHRDLAAVDLTEYLRPGKNLFAVAATNVPSIPQNPAAWIAAAGIDLERGGPLRIVSDRSWRCAKAPADGWRRRGAGADWLAAQELGRAGDPPWGMPRHGEEHRRLPARYLRKEFQVPANRKLRRATAFVCGLGFFDLYLNGERIGDQLMNPALSGYDRRALYVTFDVTEQVRRGANAVGVVLSNGRFFAPRLRVPVPMRSYGYPKLIAQLCLEFEDGARQTIVSDASWRLTTEGPVRSSNEYDGEEYDARREMPGWAAPGFDDASWQPAEPVEPPGGRLEAQMLEPIRVTEILEPRRITHPKPAVWMVDFGQAFYGVVRLKASAPAGTRVRLRTSFNVLPDGTLNYRNDRSALNTDVYTFKGEGVETWYPRFRGNATRWVQVEGFPGTPTADNFAGLVLHTDFEPVGEFACSNDLINRIYRNARWGTRMQNRSLPMEPDRDERMPWSGHPAKTSESEGWVFRVSRFYDHYLDNYRAHQADDGSLQEILPPYWSFNSKDVVWPSVVSIIPNWLHDFYGDRRVLEDNYEMMKRFVLHHQKVNLKPDFTLDKCRYGDWVDAAGAAGVFGATSRPLIGTAYFYHNCRLVERAARLLGRERDARQFHALAEKARRGFNRRFFDARRAIYESNTQCAYVLALAFDLVPERSREAVIERLVHDILVTRQGHTSVGLIGMQWQMQVLTDIGRPDVAYTIATRETPPSWGYMVSQGATTIWERWDYDRQGGGMNGESQKILSGNFEAWCYQTLAGINYDPQRPGFKHISLRPRPVGDLCWVRATHDSLYGPIQSDWKIENETFRWRVVVPPNTTATAYIPTTQSGQIRESGRPLNKCPGLRLLRSEAGAVVCRLASGGYVFSSPLADSEQDSERIEEK